MAERFLISRLSSLGDVACTLPVAAALRRRFPESRIEWIVDSRFQGVVECCTAVDVAIPARPGLAPSTWPKVEGTYDIAFDMQGLWKSAIGVARAKAERKLGYHWLREASALFSSRVLPDPTSFHIVDQYLDVARAAGCEAHGAEFHLEPKPEDTDSVREKLAAAGIAGRFVVINAGAGWATKRWPPASYGEVIDGLALDGVPCVLVGGPAPADRQAADSVAETCRERPVDLLGQTSVRELIALLSLASAHLGGDTGSTHLAAALGRPAVGLYSITRPRRSCPYGQIERCLYDPAGLGGIRPAEVLAKVREALA